MAIESTYLKNKIEKENSYCNMQVVFVDIVSYSKRASYAQLAVINNFMKLVKSALTKTAKEYVDAVETLGSHLRQDVVVLPAGDGAAIAFPYDSLPEIHLFFATSLLSSIEEHNKNNICEIFTNNGWCNTNDNFLLRCGISEGKSILYKDLNGCYNIAGNTINMAARVMSLANSGQIFFTETAYNKLSDMVPGKESMFKKYERIQIKHNLYINTFQYIENSCQGLDTAVRLDLINQSEALKKNSTKKRSINEARKIDNKTTSKTKFAAIDEEIDQLMTRLPTGTFSPFYLQQDIKFQRNFYISKYLIPQHIYKKIMEVNPSQFQDDNNPVENVSWFDAIIFCNKLSSLAGKSSVYVINNNIVEISYKSNGFRLPTELEWQYSCGELNNEQLNSDINKFAWFNTNSKNSTQNIGKKASNSYGIYDILGNVWEWCNDWYCKKIPENITDAYIGPNKGFERVLRGGAWNSLQDSILPFKRNRKNPKSKDNCTGFRVVCGTIDNI